MKATKEKDEIVIRIPFMSKRHNPYMDPDADVGEHKTLIGIIEPMGGYNRKGLAEVIDMDYKDKGDQHTDIIIESFLEDDKFKELCEELGLDLIEYPACAYCEKAIMGCSRIADKGPQCFSCELAEEDKEADKKGVEAAIAVYEPYVKLLEDECGSASVFGAVHGMKVPDEKIQKGIDCRKKIQRLKDDWLSDLK